MPELPDIVVYVEHLSNLLVGRPVRRIRVQNPFVLRSVEPPPAALEGRSVQRLQRLGKRIVFGFGDELFLVVHLMIAGRLHWKAPGAAVGKAVLVALEFENGILTLTEAGSKRRASVYIVQGQAELALHSRGGVEVLEATVGQFQDALTSENHTLKRALTDPRLFSGIGNAYSDEILHHAQLSPLALTASLKPKEIERLFEATRATLLEWVERLRQLSGSAFPEKVTAFREGMAVHGRYGQPCPRCGSPIQRIVYADNETNYCAVCQTGGRLLADRSLSRLLKQDWPRSLEELERREV